MMNIGAAEDLLLSEVREHLVLLKETFGIKYVRFCNLFAKELLIDTNQSEGMYNFSRVDSILDFILQQGMKPHIELGPKPRRIHKSVQDSLTQMEERTQIQEERWQMLMEWGKRECTTDFISMILYACIRGEVDQDRFSRRSTDREALIRHVKWMRTSMQEVGFQDKKLYVTEWNLTISDQNYINDICFKGAYVVKNILDFYGMVDDAVYTGIG